MCLHQVTSRSFLKDAEFSKLRPTFEAAIEMVIGVRGGWWMTKRWLFGGV